MEIRAKEITSNWPARASQTRDNPDRVITVFDGAELARRIQDGEDPERALWWSITARLFLRTTGSGNVYAVCLWTPPGESNRVFYGSAGGYGYDKTAAALDGMPVGTVNGQVVCLTDHCGLDQLGKFPGFDAREIIVHRSGGLPAPLFSFE